MSLEIGTHTVAAMVANGLEHDYHIPFTAAEVEAGERVYANGEAIRLADRRAQATEAVRAQLRDRLLEALDAKLAKVAGVVLCGGGATVLGRAFPRAVIPDEPQWANVEAYLGSLTTA